VLEHPGGVKGRPSARQAQPGLAGDAAEHAGRLVQSAVGELRDLNLKVAHPLGERDLASAEDNHWVTMHRHPLPPSFRHMA
jgi:hypothetical protein